MTTGCEERDGSIGPRSLAFYTRLAQGGCFYIVIGDVAPVRTANPTPKLLFHPEYDVQGVGKMIVEAGIAG